MERFIRKILTPVDGSSASVKALELALAMAGDSGAALTILQAVEDFVLLPGYHGADTLSQDRINELADEAFVNIRPLLKDTDVNWNRRVIEGYAAESICAMAQDEESDMIVMGSRGLNPLKRFFLGSVSDKVTQHAPCSVTIVRGT